MKQALLLIAILVIPLQLAAQLSTSTSGTDMNAVATFVTPLSIEKTSDMSFGVIHITGPGSCILNTDGSRSYTGSVVLSSLGEQATCAAFNVYGASGKTYTITIPSSITISGAKTSTKVVISSIVAKAASTTTEGITGTLSGGKDSFTVGGTIVLNGTELSAYYSGIFTVSVNYQ
jgi:hypothetical protein